MADTVYIDYSTPAVNAAWLNDINKVVYRLLGTSAGPGGAAPTTVAQIVANLGAASLSTSNTYASGTTQNFSSATMAVSAAVSGTPQPAQAQQLANDSLPIHATAAPNGTSFAMRNRIINGHFQINQRSYTSGTGLTSGAYAHDRWKAGAGGCTYTFTAAVNGQPITIIAGSLEQIIEDANIEGGTYTLSWSGTAQGSVNGGVSAASPITVTGLAASTAVTISFNAGTLDNVQFEPGAVATPFERLIITQQLSLCQRYYFASGAASITAAGNGGFTNVYSPRIAYPVSMRTTPTVTTADNLGATGKVSYYNGGTEVDGATVTIASNTPHTFTVQTTTGNTTTNLMSFSYIADAEL